MAAVHEPPLSVPNVKVLHTMIQTVGANMVLIQGGCGQKLGLSALSPHTADWSYQDALKRMADPQFRVPQTSVEDELFIDS